MADLDNIVSIHEAFVDLLKDLPRHVLLRIVCAAAGLSPELHDLEVRERTPVIEIPSAIRRVRRRIADLVLTVHDKQGEVVLVVVIEVQLVFDDKKRWNWPLMHVAFWAEFKAEDSVLAAFIPLPELRTRIREKLGPKMKVASTYVEWDQIELITDEDDAMGRPAETLLGAVYHAGNQEISEERRVAAIGAAFLAMQTLDERKLLRYIILMTLLPQELYNRMLERLREKIDNDPRIQAQVSETERAGWLYNKVRDEALEDGLSRGLEQGLEQGREQGLEQGLAPLRRVLCNMLERRGFELDETARGRIQSCKHPEQLESWYEAGCSATPDTPLVELLESSHRETDTTDVE